MTSAARHTSASPRSRLTAVRLHGDHCAIGNRDGPRNVLLGRESEVVRMRSGVRQRMLAGAAILALGLAVCGCGLRPQTGTTPVAGSPTIGGSATATTASGTPTGTPGPVTLTPDRGRYAPGDPILVTVHDGLTTSIFAMNNHTSCTVVQLERLVNGSWQIQGTCVNMYPHPTLTEIKPGSSATVELLPAQGTDGSTTWPVGTYRAELTYATNASQSSEQASIAYSQPVTVG
jgi:hypothetical protein